MSIMTITPCTLPSYLIIYLSLLSISLSIYLISIYPSISSLGRNNHHWSTIGDPLSFETPMAVSLEPPYFHWRPQYFHWRPPDFHWRPPYFSGRPPYFSWRPPYFHCIWPHIFVGDPHICVGDPQIHRWTPHIFIGDPQIFIGDPQIFVGDPHIRGPQLKSEGLQRKFWGP